MYIMKVNLIIREGNTKTTEQVEIESVGLNQLTNGIKTLKGIIDLVQEDENLQQVLYEMFDNEQQGEDMQEFGMRIIGNLINSLDVLLLEIPENIIQLLADLSGIDYDLLIEQKIEEVLDVYDAVIQENDIERLIERAKKSSALTKKLMKISSIIPEYSESTNATIIEAFVFKLANKLGGRNEVINTPAVELFKYMEMEIEEIKMEQENKQVEMYINYLSHVFSQQPQGKPSREFIRAKEEFERLLMPN